MTDFFKTTIGDAELYFGDSIKILPTLGECAGLVVSDVPYKLTSGGTSKPGSITEWQLAEDYNNDGSIVDCNIDWSDFMPLLYNCLQNNAHCYTMANNRNVQAMLNSAEQAGFRFHNLLTWDKGDCTPNRFYMKNCEFIGFFFKGHAKWINNMSSQQLIYCPQENYGGHPTTKPTALMKYLIENSSKENEVVCDPFMGSCATGIAALRSGRKFIGIEINEKWYKLAVKRITDFYNTPQQIQML